MRMQTIHDPYTLTGFMAIFLYTVFFSASFIKKDENFAVAEEWLKKIALSGVYGQIYTSNHVIAEILQRSSPCARGGCIGVGP